MCSHQYTLELERTIFNWYYGSDDAVPEPVYNAVVNGLRHDMQVTIPTETSKAVQRMTVGQFGHVMDNEKDHAWVPLFTSQKEMDRGEPSPSVNQSLKGFVESVSQQPDCRGCVINPWGQKLFLPKTLLEMLLGYQPKSHITYVKGSVVDMHVGAIVNAANRRRWCDSSCSGAKAFGCVPGAGRMQYWRGQDNRRLPDCAYRLHYSYGRACLPWPGRGCRLACGLLCQFT